MNMFEVKVYNYDGKLLRRNLIQAMTKDQAENEALNTFYNTEGGHYYTLE